MARGLDAHGLKRGLVHDAKLERRQTTSPRGKDYLAGYALEGQALTVHLHAQTCLQECGLSVKIPTQARMPHLWDNTVLLHLQERRDLRHIEQVA